MQCLANKLESAEPWEREAERRTSNERPPRRAFNRCMRVLSARHVCAAAWQPSSQAASCLAWLDCLDVMRRRASRSAS